MDCYALIYTLCKVYISVAMFIDRMLLFSIIPDYSRYYKVLSCKAQRKAET